MVHPFCPVSDMRLKHGAIESLMVFQRPEYRSTYQVVPGMGYRQRQIDDIKQQPIRNSSQASLQPHPHPISYPVYPFLTSVYDIGTILIGFMFFSLFVVVFNRPWYIFLY